MSVSSSTSLSSLKPHDRVLAWLDANIPSHQRRSGVRIPTTREVSRLINVSSGTVQKVYQHLAEKGLLQTEVGSGTFWTKAAETMLPVPSHKQVIKIGINVGLPVASAEPEGWAYRIFGGMFNAIIRSGAPLVLHPLSLFDDDDQKLLPDAEAMLGEISGFISFPTVSAQKVDALLQQHKIPYVTLNPASASCTTHFVAPNYFESNRLASSALARAGRKRLLLFLSPGTEQSVSCQLRLSGFASGLHLSGEKAEFRTLIAPDGRYEQGYHRFREFLAQGWIPDAVCAAGDALAKGALDAALECGIRVPEEMSIIGGSGTLHPQAGDSHYLTTMAQPLEQVGEQLIHSILTALRPPHHPVSGTNLPIPFTIGNTTRAEENQFLA